MPYDIQPLSGSWRGSPETLAPEPPKPKTTSVLPGGYDWLRSQSWDYERYLTGTSPFAQNTIKGGLGPGLFSSLASSHNQQAVVPEPPALDVPIIGGGGAKQKIGQMSLDLLDPSGTLGMLTGSFLGREDPIVGPGGQVDPLAFLQSKGIDPFGMGSTGMPARLSDYALAPIMAAAQMATNSPMPTVKDPDLQYGFQKDPTYWRWVAQADPAGIEALAYATVGRTQDPSANPWLVDQLAAQFRIDQAKTSFVTSGDAGLDYMAIKGAAASRGNFEATGSLLGDGGLTMAKMAMPLWGFLSNFGMLGGYNLTEAIDPITPEEDAFWASLPAQVRQQQFGFIGGVKMGTDFITMLPTLSAFGAVAATAKGATGLAGAAYKGYDWTLRLSKMGMATGLTAATATWALDAAWPADLNLGPITAEGVHEYTKRVDLSRPISGSEFAGLVNAIGFWSSGTMGAGTAISSGKQVGRKLVGALDHAGIPHPTAGMSDLRLYAFGLGGSDMHNFASSVLGLDEAGLKLSAQRLYMSTMLNSIRRSRFARWSAAIAGKPTHSFLDELPTEQRVELASMEMARPLESTMSEAEAQIRTLNLARQDMSFTRVNPETGERIAGPIISADAHAEYKIAQRNARSVDDGLARGFVNDYGAPFMQRLAGADTPQALRGWLESALERLGGKAENLPDAGKHSLEWWHQLVRTVYHYQFDRWAGIIHDASEGAEEGGRISIMAQRHVFRNVYDDLRPALLGEKGVEEQAAAFKKLMNTIEAEEWALAETRDSVARARYGPGGIRGPFEADAKGLADHLDDIYDTLATKRDLPGENSPTSTEPLNLAHMTMEAEGNWTLGYKPVNEAGEFVAAVETRTGQHVQTAWLDYPLSNADNIELGNRGWLGNKMDAVTRGFRTWRIVEYQRGSLFRSLSSKTGFNATQIEAFHAGVLNLSRKHTLSPQAVGRAPHWAPGLSSIADEVDQLATRVFGPGPYLDKEGKAINLRREIGNAYRQAYRLNLTAGLTSHLKASFGPVGEAITYGSDFMYVMWRFGLSPLFKGGELWESAQLNLMRRVSPTEDPAITALYIRTGASGDPAAVAAEITGADQMIQGLSRQPDLNPSGAMAGNRSRNQLTGDERAAAGLSFYALGLKENHFQALERQAAEGRAAAFRERAGGGEAMRNTPADTINARILELTDEAGDIIPGNEAEVAMLVRQLDLEQLPPDVRAALERYPEGAPTAAQIAEANDLRETAAAWRGLTERPEPPVPAGVVFTTETVDTGNLLKSGNTQQVFHVKALNADGEQIGHLTVGQRDAPDLPNIVVWVDPVYRRQGVASRLYYEAEQQFGLDLEIVSATNAANGSLTELGAKFQAGRSAKQQPLNEMDRLGMYQETVKRGWMPEPEDLRVWRRLDELVTDVTAERDKQRAWKAGGPIVINTGVKKDIDLFDPITGQPVLRDVVNASEREFDTALRSLRARRAYARKNLTIPSVDDLAHRLEIHAEAVEAPKPILRSERVGPADALPEGYTLDPAEVVVPGQMGVNTEPGQLSWLDTENTTAEGRGMWHATTKTTAILDTGIKSRAQQMSESVPAEARDMVRQAYEGSNRTNATSIHFIQADGTELYMRDNDLRLWVDGTTGDIQDARSFGSASFNLVDRIVDDSGVTRQTLWKRTAATPHVPEGLSASRPDQWVSLTTDWVHADTIASRMKLMGEAANGRATGDDLVGHFWYYYENHLGDDEDIVEAMAAALHLRSAYVPGEVDQSIHNITVAIDNMTPHEKFEAVRDLDIGIRDATWKNSNADSSEFSGYVGFAGSYEGARSIDPNEVGVVQVAVRSHQIPELDGPTIERALTDAWVQTGPGDVIRVHMKDGTTPVFIRFKDPNLTIKNGITGKEHTETDQFHEFFNDVTDGDYGAVTGVEVYNYQTPKNERQFIAGEGLPTDEKALHRVGPDQFELQSPGKDIYVIDPRVHAEPLADGEEELLRQLRMTIDDQGNVTPGYERRNQEVATRLDHMRQESLNPDPVASLEDIPDTAEGITANLNSRIEARVSRMDALKGKVRRGGEVFWDPIPTKNNALTRQVIQMQRDEFPRVIAGTGVERVFREVAGPENQWADWLVQDRQLLDDWITARTSGTDEEAAAALDRLTAHAGGDEQRAAVNDLYDSEDWATVSGLWALNLKGNGEEAFGTHFFDQYRSPLLRGINHPVLGVYPASWALKTAREWTRFLFQNHSFGQELHLGMTPAVAIQNVARSQAVTFAQDPDNQGQSWEDFMKQGPLGSSIFMFNLLMPGDWSSIPFPLSRTIREVLRGNLDPGSILASNITYSGVTRDLRLGAESWGEWVDLALDKHDPADSAWTDAPPSIAGMPMKKPKKPPRWVDTPTR